MIGTAGSEGTTNLAIFSSVVHLGSDPALISFISRPTTADVGHTYANIIESGVYTINHIHPEFIKNAHYTSAKFKKDISEFERCGFTAEYLYDFKAPFVKESNFKIGLRFREKIDITINNTILIIGEVMELILPETNTIEDYIDLEQTKGVGISGLNVYYSLSKLEQHPYVRLNEVSTHYPK
ncbi:flavin reductase family protein [Aequorivita marina]|uniref:flavin reductase family protein n=1 Tax=Aequorivita marina TaxID=3073654 RepID=UPI0028750B20|nr:flavin reductase [Aequorivita sp. S2608]MDS1299604.1 flavin reductase [Aequorivita sp. S2608]